MSLIKISKEFHINGSGLWLGTEVSIPDESNEEQKIEAFQKEYITLVKAAQRLNPGISVNQTPEPYHREPPILDYKAKEKLEIDIDNAQTTDELVELYEKAHWYNLLPHYEKRLKELQNKQP